VSLPTGYLLRPATVTDAELIQAQRDAMWLDMGSGPERIALAHALALNWLRSALADGSYSGVLAEEGGQVVAGAGVLWQSLPPSPRTLAPVRAYILNVYVVPQARGQKLATMLVQQLLSECRRRGVDSVSLHASDAGRPSYAALGFGGTSEMQLSLEGQP
jgi:ribosomal protein S18 acetylase RimI-like enzyme